MDAAYLFLRTAHPLAIKLTIAGCGSIQLSTVRLAPANGRWRYRLCFLSASNSGQAGLLSHGANTGRITPVRFRMLYGTKSPLPVQPLSDSFGQSGRVLPDALLIESGGLFPGGYAGLPVACPMPARRVPGLPGAIPGYRGLRDTKMRHCLTDAGPIRLAPFRHGLCIGGERTA